jgi:hypothetical protein
MRRDTVMAGRWTLGRGLLRLWIIASLGWIALLAWFIGPTLGPIAWPWSGPPMFHAHNKDYPAAWGIERIRAAIQQDVTEAQEQRGANLSRERRATCESFIKAREHDANHPLPEECRPMLPTAEEFLAAQFPDAEFHAATNQTPLADVTAAWAPIAFGLPLFLLSLGLTLLWVVRGFRGRA